MMTMHLLTSLQEERLFHIMQTGNKVLCYSRVTNCPVFPGHVLFSYNNITIFYSNRGGITYFKCIEINKGIFE